MAGVGALQRLRGGRGGLRAVCLWGHLDLWPAPPPLLRRSRCDSFLRQISHLPDALVDTLPGMSTVPVYTVDT